MCSICRSCSKRSHEACCTVQPVLLRAAEKVGSRRPGKWQRRAVQGGAAVLRTLVNCGVGVHAVNGADGHHVRHRLCLRQECRLQLSDVLVQAAVVNGGQQQRRPLLTATILAVHRRAFINRLLRQLYIICNICNVRSDGRQQRIGNQSLIDARGSWRQERRKASSPVNQFRETQATPM